MFSVAARLNNQAKCQQDNFIPAGAELVRQVPPNAIVEDVDAPPSALARPPAEANLRTNSDNFAHCRAPGSGSGRRAWACGCLTRTAAQCLATYSPRCLLNEFRLLHINYHGLAEETGTSTRTDAQRMRTLKRQIEGQADHVAGRPARLIPATQWAYIKGDLWELRAALSLYFL